MSNDISYPTIIDIENLYVKKAGFDAAPRPLEFQHWHVDLVGKPAKLFVNGEVVEVDYVEMRAYVRHPDMSEDILHAMFPDVYDSSPTTIKEEVDE